LPNLYFYSGSLIIFLENWFNLRKTIKQLLRDPDALLERQNSTLDWWERYCSETAVAKKIAATISVLD
jgi:hypothetical protein